MTAPMRVEGLDDVAARLARRPRLPFTPSFEPIEPVAAPPCAAVDGSHAVLADTGSTWLVAVRAAGIGWPGAAPPPPMRVLAASADTAQADIDAAFHQRGLPSPPVRSAEGFAEAHRALSELDAATQAIHALPEGGLLLVDGALTQLPEPAQALADRILDRATASGIHVAGLSKRSGLAVRGVPLVPAIDAAGREGLPGASWWSPIPGNTAVVARLHGRGPHAFRVDAETAVLPWLADLSRDAVYLGYPYPLAKVHNLVAISHKEARRLRERVERGLGRDAQHLQDFHAILDRNAPR